MASKFTKFLTATLVLGGSAAAAAYYLTQKKFTEAESIEEEDDEPEFDQDLDLPERNYVPLGGAAATDIVTEDILDEETDSEAAEVEDNFTPLSEVAAKSAQELEDELVEEFFNEDDEESSATEV